MSTERADSPLTYRRVALWGSVAAKLVGAWGLSWDITWFLSTLPAYAPLAPAALEAAAALALAVAAGAAGGAGAAWLADRLPGGAPRPRLAPEGSVAGATSPGR